jgi:hypothetical protein
MIWLVVTLLVKPVESFPVLLVQANLALATIAILQPPVVHNTYRWVLLTTHALNPATRLRLLVSLSLFQFQRLTLALMIHNAPHIVVTVAV